VKNNNIIPTMNGMNKQKAAWGQLCDSFIRL